MMIPSSTYSTPSLPTHDFPKRPLSANLSSPPPTSSLAQRRRNNKNLSLCLLPSDKSAVPPSTPFLANKSFALQQSQSASLPTGARRPFSSSLSQLQQQEQQHHHHSHYYQKGAIAVLPGFYLGDEYNASNVQQLKDLSIHCMINVAAEVSHPYAHLFRTWDQILANEPCPTLSSSSSSTNTSAYSSCTLSSTEASSPSSSSMSLSTSGSPPSSPNDPTHFSTMGYKKRAWHHHILDDDHMIQQELHAAVMDVVNIRQSGRNVLVHCQCGLARSATVVVAYVMYSLHLSMSAAMLHVKKYAPHINPNLSLMYQLREYELWLAATDYGTKDAMVSLTHQEQPVFQRHHHHHRDSFPTLDKPAMHLDHSNNDTLMVDSLRSPRSSSSPPPSPSVISPSVIVVPSPSLLKKQPSSSSLAAKWKSFKNKSSYTSSSLRPSGWWRSSTSSSSLSTGQTPTTPVSGSFPTFNKSSSKRK